MLRIDYRHRESTNDCLREIYRLRFHEIQTVDIERTTPTEKTTDRDDVAKNKSVITQTPSHRDISSGFYDIGGISESTEIAPSKRDLRDGIHFYNNASQRSLQQDQKFTQIWNPRIINNLTSTLNKRQRSQMTQSFTIDTSRKGRSKRSRILISCETIENPSKPSKRKEHNPATQPRQIPQLDPNKKSLTTDVANLTQTVEPIPKMPRITRQITRKSTQKPTKSPLRRAFASAAEINPKKIETPSSKRNVHDNVRAILAKNLDERNLDVENDDKTKIHHPQ